MDIQLSTESAIEDSLRYLVSDRAAKSLKANFYWPKWDSPWWHMALLYEMGHTKEIPRTAIDRMVESVRKMLPVFFREDIPPGGNHFLDTPCPCSLGTIYQILSAAGVDVDLEVPWARAWFLRYQMSDGGLNCDEDAYRTEPQASSMVGTIAPLEAILFSTKRPFTSGEADFLNRGALCLIKRELRLGCTVRHNLEEQEDEEDWLKPCFPRFYFYDVLRGLTFILKWADKCRKILPARAINPVVEVLTRKFPDGNIRVERHAYEGVGTRTLLDDGTWTRSPAAKSFTLLAQVSRIGQVSPYLTVQWSECRWIIERLRSEGLIVNA